MLWTKPFAHVTCLMLAKLNDHYIYVKRINPNSKYHNATSKHITDKKYDKKTLHEIPWDEIKKPHQENNRHKK